MRQFSTSVVERKVHVAGPYDTQPFEAGWASEAIFFVRVESAADGLEELIAKVQLSADGINWVDEGTTVWLPTRQQTHFVRVRHFGGWLRLHLAGADEKTPAVLTVHLALKE